MSDSGALRELRSARDNGERIFFVHYACGDFYATPDQPTPVVAIAIAEQGPMGQQKTFSLIDSRPGDSVDDRERDLLRRFYDELRGQPDARIVHWNMNSAAFGFGALAARYRYLGQSAPDLPQPDRKFDLDEIIEKRFGRRYAGHPKLRQLCNLNGLFMPHFMAGKAEADAIAKSEYGPVVNSTAEKSHLIGVLFDALCDGTLKTLNSVGLVKFAGEQVDAVNAVMQLAERMRMVSLELRKRHGGRSTIELNDEYDAQDLFRGLLRILFEDVRVEDFASSYAGASSRLDFVLPEVELAIELKYTRPSMTAASLGAELIVDRSRYTKYDKISHLLFLVFDHDDRISNPKGIESDLSRMKSEEDFAVTVRILTR